MNDDIGSTTPPSGRTNYVHYIGGRPVAPGGGAQFPKEAQILGDGRLGAVHEDHDPCRRGLPILLH